MQFEIKFINPKTGEPETQLIKEDNCWKVLNSVYSKTIPDGKIKPVNFGLVLKLDIEE